MNTIWPLATMSCAGVTSSAAFSLTDPARSLVTSVITGASLVPVMVIVTV